MQRGRNRSAAPHRRLSFSRIGSEIRAGAYTARVPLPARTLALAAALAACGSPPSGLIDPDQPGDAGASDARALACDPLAPACASGEGCFWMGPGTFECAPAAGLPRYHVCQSSQHCSPGDGCHLDDFYDFYCIGYCDHTRYAGQRDPERCGENELCGDWDGVVGRCLGICDPLAPDCPDGLGCYAILDAADLCLPITGQGAPGDPCQRSNDCAPGGGCVERGEERTCAAYCDHETNPDQADPRCADGEVCARLGPGERIGICAGAPG